MAGEDPLTIYDSAIFKKNRFTKMQTSFSKKPRKRGAGDFRFQPEKIHKPNKGRYKSGLYWKFCFSASRIIW